MKSQTVSRSELTDLIEQVTFNEPTTITVAGQYNFVAYPTDDASVNSDPMRHLFFQHNREQAKNQKFLDHARYLLDLSIDTFELTLNKRGRDNYPNIEKALGKLRIAKEEFAYLTSLDTPLADAVPIPDEATNLYFGYDIVEGKQNRQPQIYSAICDFFLLVYIPYGSWVPADINTENTDTGPGTKKANVLFANSKDIDTSKAFGIPKSLSDGLSRVIRNANRESAETQYRSSNRTSTFRTGGVRNTELNVDALALGIKAADQFAVQLMRIKDAKILQTFCALWKYANVQDSFQFRDVPVSEVMEIVLKKNEKTNFSVDDRRHFTQALQYLAALTITLQIQTERSNKKGKKQTVLQEEKGVKLFRLISEYALKKQYQKLPKDQLTDDHFDKTVITKFSGELLPDYNRNFNGRSNIYYDALLKMDANKDQKAVVLGFALQTRFNQLQNKDKPVLMERGYLIELCDYQKTDQAKTAIGTKLLRNVLNKLKDNGLTGRYENLTNTNSDKVVIYPPGTVNADPMSE